MALTLIGIRGSGKSVIGAALAARLGRPFVDADVEIERRAGRTIREIFAADGEAGFRALERAAMTELLADERLVLAAGGGAVLAVETRDAMRRSGPVVYLRTSPECAEGRIAADATTAERRPALTALPLREELRTVLAAREPLYVETATMTVETDERTIEAIVEAVWAALPAEMVGGLAR